MIRRLAVLLAACVSAPALAGELELGPVRARADLTSTTHAGWRAEGDGHGELFERLNVATGTGAWSLSLRLDTATFFSAPPPIASRYDLEKISLGWSGRSIEVSAGDAYVSFGRGLALSLRKVDELGVDTTLRGLKLLVHAGDFEATVAAGTPNINNVDEASGRSISDPYDLVGGARVQVTLFDRVTIGAHGTVAAFHDGLGLVPTERYTDRYHQVGPTIDAPELTDWLGVYLEGVVQLRDTSTTGGDDLGFGAYGSASLYLGPVTVLLEGKAYGDLAPIKPRLDRPEFDSIAYNNPPTVERVVQVLENPQRDIAGGRLRADWAFSPELLVHGGYGLFHDGLGYGDPDAPGTVRAGTIHDPHAGFEARWDGARSWAIFSAGRRTVQLGETTVRSDLHAEADVSQAFGAHVSVNLHAIHEEKRKNESAILDVSHREGTLALGLRFHPWITVSGGYDYTTDPTQPERDYFNGTVQWDITPSSSLRVFAGSQRGGLKCVSGVCRTFPPFEGGKMTLTIRL